MKLYIRHMDGNRSNSVIRKEVEKLGLHCMRIGMGELEIRENISIRQLSHLRFRLLKSGIELLNDRKSILVEKVKILIIERIRYEDNPPKTKFSEYLSHKLNLDYAYLANLFSELTGITIEQFTINQKIERVKELLIFNELNLTQISYKLNYSSVAHLSSQFKKVTGLTPSDFRQLSHSCALY